MRGSHGEDIRLAGCVLHEPRVVANDGAGVLPCVQAHGDAVGGDVPVDALGAGRSGEGARVTVSLGQQTFSIYRYLPSVFFHHQRDKEER